MSPPSPPAPDLVPLRALNQVTYCPRLYFLQYVDAVRPVNEHVEAGRFVHRRVTHPDLSSRTRKEGNALNTRNVTLSSEALGLTGVLDLLEETDADAYPVETKHGSAPRDDAGRPTFWSNDAVQLCGQALLLEEHLGRPVPRARPLDGVPFNLYNHRLTKCRGSRNNEWLSGQLMQRPQPCSMQSGLLSNGASSHSHSP